MQALHDPIKIYQNYHDGQTLWNCYGIAAMPSRLIPFLWRFRWACSSIQVRTAAGKPLVRHPRPSAALMASEHEVGHGHQPEQIIHKFTLVQLVHDLFKKETAGRKDADHLDWSKITKVYKSHQEHLHWRPGVFCQLMLLDLSSLASEGKTTYHQAWNTSLWSSMPDLYTLRAETRVSCRSDITLHDPLSCCSETCRGKNRSRMRILAGFKATLAALSSRPKSRSLPK